MGYWLLNSEEKVVNKCHWFIFLNRYQVYFPMMSRSIATSSLIYLTEGRKKAVSSTTCAHGSIFSHFLA